MAQADKRVTEIASRLMLMSSDQLAREAMKCWLIGNHAFLSEVRALCAHALAHEGVKGPGRKRGVGYHRDEVKA